MSNQSQLVVSLSVTAWDNTIKRVEKLIDSLTDEQLMNEVAPGRNRGVYLVGHLIGVHDNMFKILDLGTPLHPELNELFLSSPDKSGKPIPSVKELRAYWTEVHTKLNAKIASLTAEQWLERHTAVSADDFAKEPHRNKLNLLINRTNHAQYHFGQMVFLQAKVAD